MTASYKISSSPSGLSITDSNGVFISPGGSSHVNIDSAGNAVIVLGDDAGVTSFSIKNSSSTMKLSLASTGALSIPALTSGRVVHVGPGGLLQDSTDLTFTAAGYLANPSHVGNISNGSLASPTSVFVSGNYAYVTASGSNRLVVINISDPSNPIQTGFIANGGGAALQGAQNVIVAGNYAYVASIASGALEIVDISNPASPTHVSALHDGGGSAPYLNGAYSLAIVGIYAYVTSSTALEIVDISTPSAPVHVGALLDGGGSAPYLSLPADITISGNYAYIASFISGALEIVDISNPASPTHVGSLLDGGGGALLRQTTSIAKSGNYVYMTSLGNNAIEIVDVSNPASPVHASSLSDGGGSAPYLNSPSSLFISGNFLFVTSTGSDSLEVIDISNPLSPVHYGSILNGGSALLNNPQFVYIDGDYAYVASQSDNALEIIRVISPTELSVAGDVSFSGDLSSASVFTDSLIVGNVLTRALQVATSNATPVSMTFDGTAASAINIPFIAVSTTHSYDVTITARDTTNNLTAALISLTAVLERDSGGTVSLLQVSTENSYKSNVALSATALADDTNKGLNVQVTGLVATNINWKAEVRETTL